MFTVKKIAFGRHGTGYINTVFNSGLLLTQRQCMFSTANNKSHTNVRNDPQDDYFSSDNKDEQSQVIEDSVSILLIYTC